MEEIVKCNIITKHIAGICNNDEKKFINDWIKNYANKLTYDMIRQRLKEENSRLNIKTA